MVCGLFLLHLGCDESIDNYVRSIGEFCLLCVAGEVTLVVRSMSRFFIAFQLQWLLSVISDQGF